jgi:hypothetical protein
MALRHGVHAAASNLKRARVSRALAGNVLGSRHGLSGMCNEPKLTSPKNFRYDAPPDRQRGAKLALLLLRPIRAASRGYDCNSSAHQTAGCLTACLRSCIGRCNDSVLLGMEARRVRHGCFHSVTRSSDGWSDVPPRR